MTLKFLRCFLVAASLAACLVARAGTESEILAKARACLGPEATLDAINSIHYIGTLDTGDGTRVAVEIIFQKPNRQRVIATGPNLIEVTALDDYEGWSRTQDVKNPAKRNLSLLRGDQVRRLRANAIENLNFLRSEGFPGTVTDLGLSQLEGKPVHKVSFDHGHGIVFTRFFDPQTGRMLRTETDQGSVIREEGELLVNGVRFPSRISNTNTSPDGVQRTVVIEIEKVVLNEVFADSLFAVPMFSSGQ